DRGGAVAGTARDERPSARVMPALAVAGHGHGVGGHAHGVAAMLLGHVERVLRAADERLHVDLALKRLRETEAGRDGQRLTGPWHRPFGNLPAERFGDATRADLRRLGQQHQELVAAVPALE